MLAIENSLLVVIDVQDRLVRVMHEKKALLENLQKIIKGAGILDIPMIATEQDPEKLGATVPEISPLLDNISPIHKSSFSCCETDAFMKELDRIKRTQVLVVGVESHVCVYQSTIDLIRAGYEAYIVTDCTSSRTLENRTLGIERMRDEGAKLTGTEMVLFELLKVARGDRFREISRLVK
ncbi:MAG: hydrolase [Thermodesulfobacteriota bacterium]|nr:hydrolase [Thermodesulfobacteriota bacterium]